MNLKVANLVVIQFGVFVGIMSWLAYSHFESAKPPRLADERPNGLVNSVAPVGPITAPEDQPSQTVGDRADGERAQPIAEQPVPAVQHEYSPAAVERYSTMAAQLYYQQIAPRRYASDSVEKRPIAAVAPSYTEVAQEPAAVRTDDPAPESVAYVEPTQLVVYPQSQFVVFSSARPFRNRCQPTQQRDRFGASPHRRHDKPGSHLNGLTNFPPPRSIGVVHRRNPGVPSCPPTQGVRHRGKR